MSDEMKRRDIQAYMPTAEEIAEELAGVNTTDDFFGREGVFARLFGQALEQMLEGEMSEHTRPKGAIRATAATDATPRECAPQRARARSRCHAIARQPLSHRS